MSLGSLVLELQGNVAKTQEDMGRLNQIVESTMQRINASAMRTSRNIQDIGAAGASIRRVQGAEEAAASIDKIGHSSVGARREMLVLAHELATGNFKRAAGSAMVLGERLDIMSKIMSPTGVAVAVLAGAILGLAVAAIKGAEESKHFAEALTMTGNFAGQTEASFNAMSRSIATASGSTIGSARGITQALIETGRFGPQSINSVALAATRLEQMSGKSAAEVVKDFARMSDGVEKWAVEANKQYHFLDGAILDHIHTLESQGDKEQAIIVASEALFNSWGGSAQKNLTGIAWALDAVTRAASEAADAFKNLGRQETAAEQIAALKAQVALNRTHPEVVMGIDGPHNPSNNLNADMQKLGYLNSLARRQTDNADLTATRKAHDDQVVEAKTYWTHLLETTKTGAEQLKDEQDKIRREGALAGASTADINSELARVAKQFNHGGGGTQHADMEAALKPLQDQIEAEKKLLATRDKTLAQYYRDNLISQKGFYDTSATVIEAYNARISTLYDQEIAVIETAAKHAADAKTRTELTTKADALRDSKQQALLDSGARLGELTIQQTQDAQKYADEVEKLNSELGKLDRTQGQLAGADFDRSHASLRKQATASGDSGTLDTLDQARAATVAQAQMNELKQRAQTITESLGIAEKRIALDEQTGNISILGGEQKIGEARAESSQQLAQIAAQMQAIADASGLPTMIAQAQQFKLQTDQMAASVDVIGQKVNTTFANGFATILDNTINRTKTLKQSFLDFANSLEQSLTRLISQDLFNQLFSIGNSNGSGGGGGLGALIGMAIGLMAGGGSGSENIGASATSTPDDLISGYRATGGPTMAGGMYEVNERGPELLTYANRTFLMMGDQPGKVTPMGGSNGGGGATNWNLNIAVPPGTTRATAQQQAREIMTQAQIAQARNG